MNYMSNLMFTFVKSTKISELTSKSKLMDEMKDRIRQLMLAQHMNQQSFAEVLDISPASLSSIFNDRTKPTLNHIDAIKSKFPSINLDWLMYGKGSMFLDGDSHGELKNSNVTTQLQPTLDFDDTSSIDTHPSTKQVASVPPMSTNPASSSQQINLNFLDKKERKITEIRIFYDDQTWETFVPKK